MRGTPGQRACFGFWFAIFVALGVSLSAWALLGRRPAGDAVTMLMEQERLR
ncbi:MAG: hypothetical protein ACRDOA_10550 [Streptosporangiaceae bacterium]